MKTINALIKRFRAPAPKQLRFTYQATDENGRPLGGLQIIRYNDPSELPPLLAKQNELLLRQLAKSNRERELCTTDFDDSDVEKFQHPPVFSSRELSADERLQLSQQLLDPERASEARDLLISSALGAKPDVIAKTLNDLNRFKVQQQAVDSYVEFVSATPEYYDSSANRAMLTNWMSKRNWAATVENFNRAYRHLVGLIGVLEYAPVVYQVGGER